MSDLSKELYKLIGNYEATVKNVSTELNKINQKLDKFTEENEKDHKEIMDTVRSCERGINGNTGDIVDNRKAIERNHDKIKTLEATGVSSQTKKKIDTGLALGVINVLWEAVQFFFKSLLG